MPKLAITIIIAVLSIATSQSTARADHDRDTNAVLAQSRIQSPARSTASVIERSGFIERVIMRRVWVSGFYEARWIEPKIEVGIDSQGMRHERVIRSGFYQSQWVPGRYEAIPVIQRVYAPVQRRSYDIANNRGNARYDRSASYGRHDELRVNTTAASLY